MMYIYGNYIDEVVFAYAYVYYHWYAHDHLYSPAALIDSAGDVTERCEYDAYGNFYILEPNLAPDPDGKSDYENYYLFTGRRVDILDDGSLEIQYNRNRYYDYYTGRWLTHDPLGITPNPQKPNRFVLTLQYKEGLSLYEYALGGPLGLGDPFGLESSRNRGFLYIGNRCLCECHLAPLRLRSSARRAFDTGTSTADSMYRRDSRQHRAMRHCVASGLLAKDMSCRCSSCVGTKFEDFQDARGNQTRLESMRARSANRTGRICAGCFGPDGTSDFPPPGGGVADPVDVCVPSPRLISLSAIIECCETTIDGGWADI